MGFLLTLALLLTGASNEGSGIAFQVQLGYEPGLMAKGDYIANENFLDACLVPYGEFYLNHAAKLKLGINALGGWEARVTASTAASLIPDGNSPISLENSSFQPRYGYTRWDSKEFSAGAELGHAIRFRQGKGNIFFAFEYTWADFDAEVLLYNYDYDPENTFDTAFLTASSQGLQGYVGVNFPLVSFSNFSVHFTPMVKGGNFFLKAGVLPSNAVWEGYEIPRWGVVLGLTLEYGAKTEDLSYLPDLKLKSRPKEPRPLIAFDKPYGCCVSGMALPFQATCTFLCGPVIGVPLGLYGAVMQFDNFPSAEKPYLAYGCYWWPTVGSVLGAMTGGAIANLGGSWAYTILGALAGQAADFLLVQGYIILSGGDPWRFGPDMNPYYPHENGRTTKTLIIAGSTFSAIGALIGYNLSIKHAELMEPEPEDMGYRPTWDEICREKIEWEWDKRDKDGVRLQLLRVDF